MRSWIPFLFIFLLVLCIIIGTLKSGKADTSTIGGLEDPKPDLNPTAQINLEPNHILHSTDPIKYKLTEEEMTSLQVNREVPDDYLRSRFAYRYGNSFVYYPPADGGQTRDYMYKVYPLCCEKCKVDAKLQASKQRQISSMQPAAGIAHLESAFLASEPPRHQAQDRDNTQYVVFKIQRYPTKLTDVPENKIKASDIHDLMATVHRVAEKFNWVIRDLSVSNICLSLGGRLCLQHIDFSEPVDLTNEINIFYNRYSMLKHLPRYMFFSDADYDSYVNFKVAAQASSHHGRDYPKLVDALIRSKPRPKPPANPRPK